MKKMKKALSLIVCLIMAMALCVPAFAADTDTDKTVTLTISNAVADHTYSVYQILKGEVSGLQNGSGTLSNMKVGDSVKSDYTNANDIAEALKNKKDGELSDAAYAYVDTTKAAYATLSTTTASTKVAPGYYVIVDTSYNGSSKENVVFSRNMVAVVGDTTVTTKTSTPTVDKNIVNTNANKAFEATTDAAGNLTNAGGKTDTAAIGDTIQYAITGTVPNTTGYSYYYYILNDTLSAGLTFQNDIAVSIISKDGTKSATLTKDTDYYVYTGEKTSDGHTFEVAFKDMKSLYAAYGEGAVITVSYTAIVNENAVIGTLPNTNDVYLQYSNKPNESEKKDKGDKPGTPDTTEKDPTGKTPVYETKTYVTRLELAKVDQDSKALQGATFELTGANLKKVIVKTYTSFEESSDGTYYKLKDGTYTTEAARTEDQTLEDGTILKANADKYESTTVKYKETTKTETSTVDTTNTKVTATVGEDGKITFTGLNVGKYTLHESVTPEGYNTVADITFEIKAAEEGHVEGELKGGNISWSTESSGVTEKDGTFYVTVMNRKGDVLPSTGGIGTTIFYVTGTILMLGAAVMLITRRRMSR